MARTAKPAAMHLQSGVSGVSKKKLEKAQSIEAILQIKVDDLINPPDILIGEHARSKWTQIIKGLREMGVLSGMDVDALVNYCDAYQKVIDARKEIDKHGLLLENETAAGRKIVENPAVSIQLKFQEQMRKIASEFGFNPASRAKLAMYKSEEVESKKNDEFGEDFD